MEVLLTRNSHLQIFFKIGALENFAILTGKIPGLEFLFNKVVGLKAYWLKHMCLPVNIAKFLRKNSFSIEHLRWLLLTNAYAYAHISKCMER